MGTHFVLCAAWFESEEMGDFVGEVAERLCAELDGLLEERCLGVVSESVRRCLGETDLVADTGGTEDDGVERPGTDVYKGLGWDLVRVEAGVEAVGWVARRPFGGGLGWTQLDIGDLGAGAAARG